MAERDFSSMDFPATILTPSTALLPNGGTAPAVTPPGAGASAVSPFAALLPVADPAPLDPALPRQAAAGNGKALPVDEDDLDPDPPAEAALAMAWSPALPTAVALPAPMAQDAQPPNAPTTLRPAALLVDTEASAPAMSGATPGRGTFEPLQQADAKPLEPVATPAPTVAPIDAAFIAAVASPASPLPVAAPQKAAFVPDAILAPAATLTPATSRAACDTVPNAGIVATPQVGMQTRVEAPAPAPAAQVFAAALHRFAAPLDSSADTGEDDTSMAPPAIGGTLLASAPLTAGAVHAPLAADTALDMTGRDWPEAMITRIEALREAHDAAAAKLDIGRADASNATLRLSPDALGTVEVSLRRDADQVHVHIQAEQPRAQTLLADARPRLTELAEANGIRLQHAGTGSSDGSGQHAPRQQPTAATLISNRTAAAPDAGDDDHRIA